MLRSHELVRVKGVGELLVLEVLLSELSEDCVEVDFETSNRVLKLEGINDFRMEDTHVPDEATVQGDGSSTSRHPSGIVVISSKFEVLDLVFAFLKLSGILETNRASLLHDLFNHTLDHFEVSILI